MIIRMPLIMIAVKEVLFKQDVELVTVFIKFPVSKVLLTRF